VPHSGLQVARMAAGLLALTSREDEALQKWMRNGSHRRVRVASAVSDGVGDGRCELCCLGHVRWINEQQFISRLGPT
jgi:hypothetical protein